MNTLYVSPLTSKTILRPSPMRVRPVVRPLRGPPPPPERRCKDNACSILYRTPSTEYYTKKTATVLLYLCNRSLLLYYDARRSRNWKKKAVIRRCLYNIIRRTYTCCVCVFYSCKYSSESKNKKQTTELFRL